MNFAFALTYIFFAVPHLYCFPDVFPGLEQQPVLDNLGSPLIITPLIKEGKIKDAQEACTVKFGGFKKVTSYAAYLTVDESHKSNLFFWFFPSQTDYANAPVILWLQGGPGATSMLGLFMENGPFVLKNKHGLKLRQYSWTENHSVIYMDNPAGSGYSFTDDGGYAQNQTIIGDQLYEAMLQFFQLFPELQKNNLIVSSESYGGKYGVALAYAVHKNNPGAKQKVNLQGVTLGNAFCDPINQLGYSDYLYQIGLVDANDRDKFKVLQDEAVKCVEAKQWAKAAEVANKLVGTNTTLFHNVTKSDNIYNYLHYGSYWDEMISIGNYIQRSDIRSTIHVGNSTFHADGKKVQDNLNDEYMQSVAPWIAELLDHYRFLFYNGQLDVVVAYPLTLSFLQKLQFSAADKYKTAVRQDWYVDSQLAGYVKQAGNLYEVLVRNSGHLVPMDQPKWALDLITRFTRNKPFNTDQTL